jgi:hypothetical protein
LHYACTASAEVNSGQITLFSPARIIVNFISLTSSVKIILNCELFIEEKVSNALFTDKLIPKEKETVEIIMLSSSESEFVFLK